MGKFAFKLPEAFKIRVIIDTDAGIETDDDYAIVYALISPKMVVKGIVAEHFNDMRGEGSMEESYREIATVLDHMGLKDKVPFYRGSPKPMGTEGCDPNAEGIDFIIEEAMRDDPMPLYFLGMGPITNLALALQREPRIADKMSVIWVGGGQMPGGFTEFNLNNDIQAANYVMSGTIPVSCVQTECYNGMKVGLSTLQTKVKPCGEIGEYLFQQLVDRLYDYIKLAMNANPDYCENETVQAGMPLGESWYLADVAAVAVALEPHNFMMKVVPAQLALGNNIVIGNPKVRPITVYDALSYNYIFDDFFSKLEILYKN